MSPKLKVLIAVTIIFGALWLSVLAGTRAQAQESAVAQIDITRIYAATDAAIDHKDARSLFATVASDAVIIDNQGRRNSVAEDEAVFRSLCRMSSSLRSKSTVKSVTLLTSGNVSVIVVNRLTITQTNPRTGLSSTVSQTARTRDIWTHTAFGWRLISTRPA